MGATLPPMPQLTGRDPGLVKGGSVATLLLIPVFLLLLIGGIVCAVGVEHPAPRSWQWQRCVDTGGIPIVATIGWQMADCIYPPEKTP